MKTFRSLVVLKRPQQELWIAMRDHMVDFAGNIADIESIRQIERTTDANNVVHVVNEWRVRQQVPAMLRSILKASELSWIDRNTWDASSHACAWAIEPNFLTDHIACSGTTSFAPAIAVGFGPASSRSAIFFASKSSDRCSSYSAFDVTAPSFTAPP